MYLASTRAAWQVSVYRGGPVGAKRSARWAPHTHTCQLLRVPTAVKADGAMCSPAASDESFELVSYAIQSSGEHACILAGFCKDRPAGYFSRSGHKRGSGPSCLTTVYICCMDYGLRLAGIASR